MPNEPPFWSPISYKQSHNGDQHSNRKNSCIKDGICDDLNNKRIPFVKVKILFFEVLIGLDLGLDAVFTWNNKRYTLGKNLTFFVNVVKRFGSNVERDEGWNKVADEKEGEDVSDEVVFIGDTPGENEEGERENGGVEEKVDNIFDNDCAHFSSESVSFFPVSKAFGKKIEREVGGFDDEREYDWEEDILWAIVGFLSFSKICNKQVTAANEHKCGTIRSKDSEISIFWLELEIFPHNLMRLSQWLHIHSAAIDLDETSAAKWVENSLVDVFLVLGFEVEFVLRGLEFQEDFVGAEGFLLPEVEFVFDIQYFWVDLVDFVLHFFHFVLLVVFVVKVLFGLVNWFLGQLRDVTLNFMRIQNVHNVKLLEMVQNILASNLFMIHSA